MPTKPERTAPMIPLPGTWLTPDLQLIQPIEWEEAWEARNRKRPGEKRAVRFIALEEISATPEWATWRAQFDANVVTPIESTGEFGTLGYAVQPFNRSPTLAQLLAQEGSKLSTAALRGLFEAVTRFYLSAERRGVNESSMGTLRACGVVVHRFNVPHATFELPEFGMPLTNERIVEQLRALARVMFAQPHGGTGAREGVPAAAWALTDPHSMRGAPCVAAFLTEWNASWRVDESEEETRPLSSNKAPASIIKMPPRRHQTESYEAARDASTPTVDVAEIKPPSAIVGSLGRSVRDSTPTNSNGERTWSANPVGLAIHPASYVRNAVGTTPMPPRGSSPHGRVIEAPATSAHERSLDAPRQAWWVRLARALRAFANTFWEG